MGDHQRPSPQPVTGLSSHSGSSSSVPSATSYTGDQAKPSTVSTSPSGRLTFVFPPSHKPRSRPAQRSSHDVPLAELPSSDLLPSPSTVSSGESRRRIVMPGQPPTVPLKLITDETLVDVFGPPPNRSVASSAPSNLEAWVVSSRQTIVPSTTVQAEEDQGNGYE
ncbi:hypothetical protein FRC12_010306 [Ceratobasidium sp. 428]|nr:hypothetical protein FRC12_010306 [Ceratobasidium sp. 428]